MISAEMMAQEDSNFVSPTNNLNTFDRAVWDEATRGIDYQKKDPEKKLEGQKTPDFTFFNGLGKSFQIIAIIVGVILLFLVLYALLKGGIVFNKKDKKLNKAEALIISDIEANLPSSDIRTPLQNAIENDQFSLAIRLYYLNILQNLTQKGHIQWKKDKTNAAYVREIQEDKLKQHFKFSTRIFENIWYGEKKITHDIFKSLEPDFIKILDEI